MKLSEKFRSLTGNICDRRLWRIKEASVGAAVDFVRRSKPHKQNRAPQEGKVVNRNAFDRASKKHIAKKNI